eukprot:scaffold75364_cov57-Phaeocystis_antarctica.AAC.1
MHITNELIHNPGVNQLLGGMDIKFMEKDETQTADPEARTLTTDPNPGPDAAQKGGKRFDTVGEGDVVILPAFALIRRPRPTSDPSVPNALVTSPSLGASLEEKEP